MPLRIPALSSRYWEEAQSIFFRALDRAPEERAEFASHACGTRSQLLNFVQLLLECYEPDDDFRSKPVVRLAPERPAPFEPGMVLSERFRIESQLGSGGMGEVYASFDLELNERVALKRMLPGMAGSEQVIAQFKLETALARRVTHRSICRVIDFHIHRDQNEQPPGRVLYLTMELLEGETLAERLRRTGSLSPELALHYLRQILDGLEVAHHAGIIHRDLKPANIMLVPDGTEHGRAVILDFGLALTAASSGEAGATAVAGTLAYMPPEQHRGEALSPASDLFAVGVTLHEMLTGRLPAPGTALTQLLCAADGGSVLAEAAPTDGASVKLPRRLARGILRCMEPEPSRRLQDVQAVREEFGIEQPTRRWVAGIVLTLAGGGLASAGWFAYYQSRKPYVPLPEAERHYKLGLEYGRGREQEAIESAIEEFRSAVQSDPNFAAGWAELANMYCVAANFSAMPTKLASQNAEEAAQRALTLDQRQAKAHSSLAYVLAIDFARWGAAEEPLRRAVELDPKDAHCRTRLAGYLGRRGQHEEAIRWAESAVALQPAELFTNYQLAAELMRAMRWHQLRTLMEPLARLHPAKVSVHLTLSRACEWLRDFKAADVALETAERLPGDRANLTAYRATLEAAKGNLSAAASYTESAWKHFEGGSLEANVAATMAAASRNRHLLFEAIRVGFAREEDSLLAVPTNPYVYPYRQEPEFQAFLRRIRYPGA